MAGASRICVTDATGENIADYRFLNSVLHGTEIKASSVLDMINKVTTAAGKGTLKALYINGHGAPGFQAVGCGRGGDTEGARSLQVDTEAGTWDPQLKGVAAWAGLGLLGECIAADGWLILSGCKVASGNAGKALLKAVARTAGAWTMAADATQFSWMPGMQGQVYKCSPRGELLNPDGTWDQ